MLQAPVGPLREAYEQGKFSKESGPFQKLSDNLIYRVRVRNRAHVTKILELHELNPRQCGRQESCHPVSGRCRVLAYHVEHGDIE
jgi:hypothetical protein